MSKDIEFQLLPKQAEFLFGIPEERFHVIDEETGLPELFTDISCYQGGQGSGKTHCGALRGVALALRYPGIKGFIGAATQDQIDGTTKVKYVEHLENIGLKENVHWRYANRSTEIHLINGSILYFKTLSNPEQWKSFEFGFVEFEEASLLDESAYIFLLGRLRQPKKPEWDDHFCYQLFMHTNPGGTRGWIYKRFINPKTKVPDARYINAPTYENIFLPKTYTKTMEENYSAAQCKELIEGRDVDFDNTIAFPEFTEENVREIKYNPNHPLRLSCDFNVNPMCWYIMQDYDDCWYILDELIANNITTADMCPMAHKVLNKYGVNQFILSGDAAGKMKTTTGNNFGIMIQYFSQRGFRIIPQIQASNPLIKDRLAVLRGTIKNAKGVKKLFVRPSCEKLIYNFMECRNQLSTGNLKQPTENEIKRNDELRYLIHPIDAISYPIWLKRTNEAWMKQNNK